MYYVTMTDKFFSGWGLAQGKIAKYVLECDTYQEARIVEENAHQRSEMKNVNICTSKPYYPATTHQVTYKDKTDAATWYKHGAFR